MSGYYLYQRPLRLSPTIHCNYYLAYQQETARQQRAYIQAFQPSLLNVIINRLQLKNPDHHPNVSHKVEEVYKAAQLSSKVILHSNKT